MVTSGKGALSVQRGLFTHGSNYTDPVLIDIFILWPALLLRHLLRYDLLGIATGGTRRGRDGMVTPNSTRRGRRGRWGQRMRGHLFVGDDEDGLRSRRNGGSGGGGGGRGWECWRKECWRGTLTGLNGDPHSDSRMTSSRSPCVASHDDDEKFIKSS